MKTFTTFALLALTATCTVGSLGCKKEPTDATPAPAAGNAAPGTAATADPVNADMAKLDKADYDAAVAQRICPVTEEALGSMGTPIKVTVEGRDVFLCCEGCVDAIKADPAKYLAILDAAKAAPAAADAEGDSEKAAN